MAKRKRRSKQPKPDLPLFEMDLPLRPEEEPADRLDEPLLDEPLLGGASAKEPSIAPLASDQIPETQNGPTELTLDDIEPLDDFEPLASPAQKRSQPEPLSLFPEKDETEKEVIEAHESNKRSPAGEPFGAEEILEAGSEERIQDFDPFEESSAEEDEDFEVEPEPARLRDRLLAGMADLSIIAVAIALAAAGVLIMGVSLEAGDQWPLAALALTFSFLYTVIPLAFWGQTPGMAWLGLMAFGLEHEPLTFQQTLWRWIGSILTLVLLGLPLLLTLRGDSLSDRLSQSQTMAL